MTIVLFIVMVLDSALTVADGSYTLSLFYALLTDIYRSTAAIAFSTIIMYVFRYLIIICSARRIKLLSNHSALKGITFLSIFVYKYIADTSFILISCSTYEEYGFVSAITQAMHSYYI